MGSNDTPDIVPSPDNDLQRFFDLSLDLLAIVVNGYFVRLNPAWERILGYSIEELLHKPAMDFIHPDDIARTNALDKQIIADGGSLINFQNRYRCKDGTYKWLEWTAHHYPEENTIYCIARDITDRKQTEEALNQREQALSALLDGVPNTASMTQIDGTIVMINQRQADVIGKPLQEIIGKKFADLLPEEALKGRDRILEAIKERKAITLETEFNGRHFETTVTPIMDNQGEIVALVNSSHETTHLKQTELALRKSEKQFRSMLEAAGEGILVTDSVGDIVLINQAIEKQFGYTRDELMGAPVEILLPEAQRKTHIRHRQNFVAHPRMRPMHGIQELTGKRKDGSIFPVEVSLSYIRDGDLLVIAFIIDITERKHIEQERLDHQQLQDEVKKERELIELRQRFMSMISHEFRTPLTAIASSCEILDHYYDRLTEQQRMERVRGLNTHVYVMVSLLDDILMLNKIQAGMAKLNSEPLDITTMCLRILETVALIDQGQHHLAFNTNHPSITIHADPRVLEHILTNLLSNAIKYSPDGTRIDFQLTGTEDGITFMVRDEGRGIPEEEKSRLFEPFHRARNVGQVRGTGLGLAIVKNNVELHGGSIRFQSTEGKGTTFWVELPVSANYRN